MIQTLDELKELFREYESVVSQDGLEISPFEEVVARTHVETVSELFAEWSDNEIGYLLVDVVQILRVDRHRSDMVKQVYDMVAAHDYLSQQQASVSLLDLIEAAMKGHEGGH